jgi:hypothetical protein
VSYELIQDKWRDEDMDDAEEWETVEGQPVKPVTLEELLEFLAEEDDMAEDKPEEVDIREVLRRMGR